ncbi:hypothetical protein WA556_003234, partial [Blastocystis sp. ATCC 50177/Nand II]
MASERERDRKKGESTCLQLLFSFTVLLSEINSILEKYCSTIASIVNEHLNWAIVYDMSSIGFVLNICHILFSREECFYCHELSTLLSIASLLHSYLFQRSDSSDSFEDKDYVEAIQCLILFWSCAPLVLPRSEIPGVLAGYFSFLEAPKRIPVTLRSSFLASLRRSLQLFPD